MDSPTPTQRRAWRLAFLLTGNADAASSLLDRVPRLRESLEPAILDRLIIQPARSLKKSDQPALPSSGTAAIQPAAAALAAALRLPHQPLEAWVLRRLDDLDDLHIARAMDCSKTAFRLHLGAADEAMARRLGDRLAPSIAALLAYADALDPAALILQHRELVRKQRKSRRVKLSLIAAALLLIASFIALSIILSN